TGAVAEGAQARVGLELVQCRVVGEIEQDHVVEVPAVGDVVPAEEADPVLRLVLADLAGEEGPHVELEEGIATAADREVGRQNGHGPAVLQSTDPGRRIGPAAPGGHRVAYCRTAPSSDGGGSSPSVPGGPAAGSAACAPCWTWSSSSPTVFVALPSGRRRPRRSAATRRSRKMIVWPVTRSRMTTANNSAALTWSGHFQTTLSGVRTMKMPRTMSWNRKHPSPGPRSGSRSSPLYWTGLALIVTSGKGMRSR